MEHKNNNSVFPSRFYIGSFFSLSYILHCASGLLHGHLKKKATLRNKVSRKSSSICTSSFLDSAFVVFPTAFFWESILLCTSVMYTNCSKSTQDGVKPCSAQGQNGKCPVGFQTSACSLCLQC